MKLQVNVYEARGLAAKAADGTSNAYVNLQLGRTSSSTSVVYRSLNPSWNEEFSFRVDDLEAEVLITVWDKDCFSDAFLGRIKQSVSKVLNAENRTLSPAWYPLQQRKSKGYITGEILLSFSLYGSSGSPAPPLTLNTEPARLSNASSPSPPSSPSSPSSSSTLFKKKKSPSRLGLKVAALFSKSKKVHPSVNSNEQSPVLTSDEGDEATETEDEGEVFLSFFGEESTSFLTSHEALPAPLPGGVLLEQTYATTMKELNAVIFKPGSPFLHDLHTLQKTTDLVEGPWTKTGNEAPRRVLTYVKAPTKLVKAVKATEEQTYLRADDKGFVVLVSVCTPDVPCGTSFRTEVQFFMTPVILDSGQEHCHLRVSWRMNFLQSIMIKGVVERGARQGLKENYQEFAEVLSKYARPATNEDSNKADNAPPEELSKSDWELFTGYIRNPVVIATFGLLFFMLLHIFLADSGPRTGLEFWELQLPDSLSEFLTAAFLTLQLQRIWIMASKFLRARVGVVGDHGIKAKGEGWLLTVTLVEGENLPFPDDSACLDPYVVFTCSGKTRTSSVKLQTTNPKWTEIFEFDATADPPSTLELEVFNYDGPFPEAESLGSAEINFLKHTSKDLADIWVALNGRRAQSCGSRLHLRIFLTNTKETDVVVDYVKKVEKEVGSKIVKISAQRNTSFQKLFSLPPEEFLINDFACAIKRKIPLQGRLFLSPRMLGFYSNIFGHKTKFSILWEDIEEVQELPPSLANVGPSIVVFTRRGRAHDADQGAKSMDAKGRLKFQFQSFVRAGPAFRTLSVLWKNRTLSPEEQVKMVCDVEARHKLSDGESQTDDSGDFLGVEDPNMTQVYRREMPFTTRSLHMLYTKENLEYKIMEKMGYSNIAVSPWENVNGRPSVQQRQVNYKFNRRLCQFASAVSAVQQKEESENGNSITLDCLLALHDVPFGENFQIQIRKEIRTVSVKPPRSNCTVFVGIVWHKGTLLHNRITSNIFEQFTKYLKEELELTVKEILSYKNHHAYILHEHGLLSLQHDSSVSN